MVITGHILLPSEKSCEAGQPRGIYKWFICVELLRIELSDQPLLFVFYKLVVPEQSDPSSATFVICLSTT